MRKVIAMLVVLGALLLTAPAYAGSACQVYNPQTCNVTTASGSLPFTGLNVGLIIAIGAGLIVGGATMYRFNKQSGT